MSASQRTKGAAGEREFLKELGERLGLPLTRNLGQSRDGGADCVVILGLAIEVKRQERLSLGAWWEQACNQAQRLGALPVLAYRQSYQPWRCVVPLGLISDDYSSQPLGMVATLGMDEFALVLREWRARVRSADHAPNP